MCACVNVTITAFSQGQSQPNYIGEKLLATVYDCTKRDIRIKYFMNE